MQKDYKMFPPSVDWDNIDWSTRRPQMDFPIQVSLSLLLNQYEESVFTKPSFLNNAGAERYMFAG